MLLLEHESKALLEKYGIKTAACTFCETEEQAIKAAKQIGFPVVMKVAGREIVHKSDVGGVMLNINSEEEVRKAFQALMSIPKAEGVNVQPQVEKGIEVIVGVAENEQFGSVVMFGLGGVFVEVLKDVSFRLLPLTRRDAEEMVREVKGYKLLEGYRGMRGDVEAVINLLLKLNELVEKESIVEMDLNPVFVYEKGLVVADARIVVGERKKFDMEVGDISFFFNAESVAVVGASTNPIKVGNSVLRSLMSNRNLRIYPINPKADEILGLKAYPSIKSLPEVPDIAIITVPADYVVDAVREAAEIGVEGVVIISSGFKEAEVEEGKLREEELRKIAKKYGIRIIGPNTFGIVSVINGLNASFTPMFSDVKRGRIALVSQSGGICHYIVHQFRDLGFSHILHLGNRCDVDFPDVLRFLAKDENTDVVALYIEGTENGRGIFEELKELCKRKKVVVMKSGRSSVADKASVSHTGSMAGDYRVFASAMKQAGAVVVETPTELMDSAMAMAKFEEVKGGVAVLTIQAGLGIVAADIIETSGGRLAKFEEDTVRKLKSLLPPITLRENPVDMSFSGLDLHVFAEVIDTVCQDEDTGIVMFLYAVAPPSWVLPAEVISQIMGRMTKPSILVYSSTPENYAEIKEALKDSDSLTFDSVERAARVAAILLDKRNYF